jgi:hypothetical protein
MKTKPIHEIRLSSIKAAVWKNETDAGARYNTSFSRLYKDGENWASADTFGRDDLLLLAQSGGPNPFLDMCPAAGKTAIKTNFDEGGLNFYRIAHSLLGETRKEA